MALADIMMRRLGHLYVFGGAPGRDAQFGWDCSSAVNWCASRDGRRIPGYGAGKYVGSIHGPTTFSWQDWAPHNLHRIARDHVQRNDIVLWHTHIGIAIDNTKYVSASFHGAFDGVNHDTIVAPIHGGGPIGETASFWRYGHGGSQGGGGGGGGGGSGQGLSAARTAWGTFQHMSGPWASWQYKHLLYIRKRTKELTH